MMLVQRLLNHAEIIFTDAAYVAEKFSRRFSWRLGVWAKGKIGNILELICMARVKNGWDSVDPDLAKALITSGPHHVPEYIFAFLGIRSANGIPPERPAQVSWIRSSMNDEGGRPRFLFHALHMVWEYVEAYRRTGKEDYRDIAQEVTRSWMQECLCAESSEHVWDDHGSAIRSLVLCHLWEVSREDGAGNLAFARDLLRCIFRHAEKLSRDSFYRPGHNHGVTQAYALMSIGLLFGRHPQANRWVQTGISRLEEQMSRNVSHEGVHREHSPAYQFSVLQQFSYAYRLAGCCGVSFSKEFEYRMKAMLEAGTNMLKPDGTMPALGDTCRDSENPLGVEEVADLSGEGKEGYAFLMRKGVEGKSPGPSSVMYPGGGIAVLRSGWGARETFLDERYAIIRLSTFHTAHVHRDVFTFELYGYGEELIVDSGGPFAYGSEERTYFVSTAAHNTVVVDNKSQDIVQAEIRRWVTTKEFDLLEASHRGYPQMLHRRLILFLKPHYYFIFDRLEGDREHHYGQLFHLGPRLCFEKDNEGVRTVNEKGGATIRILPLFMENLETVFHHGTASPMQGWICTGERIKIPNAVLKFVRSGKTGVFGTLLIPEPRGVTDISQCRVSGEIFFQDVRITLRSERDGNIEILLPRDGEPHIRNSPHEK